MILALALCMFAQIPAAGPPPRIENPAELRAFNRAHKALLADTDVLGQYRRLRAYLATDPELRQAEESHQALLELPGLRARVDDFEEVLRADAPARSDFNRCFARLKRDPTLREAIEQLASAETAASRGRPDLVAGLGQLRERPDTVADFLHTSGRGLPVYPPLRLLREALRRDHDLESQLREAWTRLGALTGAREAVYPWWARAYGETGAVSRAWHALDVELTPFPSRRRAWEDRSIAWAAHPDAVAWRDHFYARVRRDPALAPAFFEYLHLLRVRPDLEDYVERDFAAATGATPAWPPSNALPSLPPWQPRETIRRPEDPKAPSLPSPRVPTAGGPERPTIDRPASPSRPTAPERTRSPAAPASPPNPEL